jgi:hypothetical protein
MYIILTWKDGQESNVRKINKTFDSPQEAYNFVEQNDALIDDYFRILDTN